MIPSRWFQNINLHPYTEGDRVGNKTGCTFYDYDYRLVTTHGNKRVMNSVRRCKLDPGLKAPA